MTSGPSPGKERPSYGPSLLQAGHGDITSDTYSDTSPRMRGYWFCGPWRTRACNFAQSNLDGDTT
jgi:hypothetical protein